jgi:8-oxo-dGTP pyrophosphatase MutT (NUDIX family)
MEDDKPKAPPAPVTPTLASTLLLLRNGTDGVEVLLMRRHKNINFAGGAFVFPGGKLDPADFALAQKLRAGGASDLAEEDLAFRLAVIRETFEESGLLLARHRATGKQVDAADHRRIEAAHREIADWQAMLDHEALVPAVDLLVPLNRWITPAQVPRRFDTMFYVAAAPDLQVERHDGSEMMESVWMSPATAIARHEASSEEILFPTIMQIRRLRGAANVTEALALAAAIPLATITPVISRDGDGHIVTIPPTPGYDILSWPAIIPSHLKPKA